MDGKKNYHMTPAEFRHYGRTVVDWIADYYEQIESLPVLSRVDPGHIRSTLPAGPPEYGEPFEDILKDVADVILPGSNVIRIGRTRHVVGYQPGLYRVGNPRT